MVIIIFYLLIFLVLLIFYNSAPNVLEVDFIATTLFIDFISIIFFIVANYKGFKENIFRHSIFILLGYVIVHFQHLAEFVIKGNLPYGLNLWVNEAIVCQSLVLSSLGLISFLLGYEIYKLGKMRGSLLVSEINNERFPVLLASPKFLVFISYLLLFLFLLTANPLYLAGHYGSEDPGTIAKYIQLLFWLFFYSSIIIKSWNVAFYTKSKSFLAHIREIGVSINVLALLFCMFMLFIGDRGPAIMVVMIYLSGFVFRVKNKPKPVYLLVLLFFGAALMSLVGEYRKTDKNLSVVERLVNSYEKKEVEEVNGLEETSELAGSVKALHYAVAYVPNVYDYKYGRFQILQLVASIPGSAGFLYRNFDSSFENQGSAYFITYLDQGYDVTWGLGTTVVADFYIDLGFIGVIVGMFIFGLFVCKFELLSLSEKPLTILAWVFILIYMARSIYIGRSSALFPLQESLWIYLIIMLNNFLLKQKI